MKTGIVRCGFALLSLVQGNLTYETPYYFPDAAAGTREYSAEPKGDVHAVWANSVLVYQGVKNSGYDIDLTLIDYIDDIAQKWFGDANVTVDGASGVAEEGKAVERPQFALIISEETTDENGVTHIFYNCRAGKKPTVSGKTSEEGDWDDQFPEYSITASPIKDPTTGKYWVRADIQGTDELDSIEFPELVSAAASETPANPGET